AGKRVPNLHHLDGLYPQLAWFSAQAILLAVGIVGAMVHVRYKTGRSLLVACALVVIIAELAGRVAFYNLWTLPM
nr:hypothetical protein [Candidatus Symbiopectobacterium sp. Dall1.0]